MHHCVPITAARQAWYVSAALIKAFAIAPIVSSAIGSSVGGQATGISTDVGGSGHWTSSEGGVEGVAHAWRHNADHPAAS